MMTTFQHWSIESKVCINVKFYSEYLKVNVQPLGSWLMIGSFLIFRKYFFGAHTKKLLSPSSDKLGELTFEGHHMRLKARA